MVVLSARFAVLASICAVIAVAIPPPVEAAHLYAGHSMEKHASPSHTHQRTHSASFPDRPDGTHRHDGENNGRHPPDHRSLGLPPLLRRYRTPDHAQKLHNHQGQDPHDHANHKAPRSAFARSRYRRATTFHSRRSSVYVHGEHGNTYLVSRTPPRNRGNGHSGASNQSPDAHNRRQVDESNLALGRIDIMGSTQRLASLTVDSTPIDWTSGQTTAKAFPLNASTTNQTQFIMMPTDSDPTGGFDKHVTLATEVFDASSAEMVMYCATYDPDPGATSALLMTPCTTQPTPVNGAGDPCAGDEDDASSSNPHESQIFSYDPSNGKIEPISAIASSSGTGNSSNDPASCAGARVRRDNGNSTTSSSAIHSSTSTSAVPTASALQQARNVTLVYVAGALEVPAPSSSPSNTISTSRGQAPIFTTTITTTVFTTETASGSSDRTVTPVQAAVSVSVSSTPSKSTTISTPSIFSTPTRSSLSLSSPVSTPAPSRVPPNADESFEVEIVGITPSTTASSSSTFTATTTTTTTTTSHSSASTALDAQAIASSIVNKIVSRRGEVVASVSIV